MPFDPNTHVGCAAWIERGGSVLLMKRANVSHGGGSWALPGGWVDFGEDPAESVVREVAEELGIRVLRTSLMSVVADTWDESAGPGHVVCVTYAAAVDYDDEPQIMEPTKCEALWWASFSDLAELMRGDELFPATRSVLDEIAERFVRAAFNDPSEWKSGDACGKCGSTDTWEDIVEGGQCNGCGASDADE